MLPIHQKKRSHFIPPLNLKPVNPNNYFTPISIDSARNPSEQQMTPRNQITRAMDNPFPEASGRILASLSSSKREQEHRKAFLEQNLIAAISSGDLATFQSLLEEVPDINHRKCVDNGKFFSLLSFAIFERQIPICRYLIENKEAIIDSQENLDTGDLPAIVQALEKKPMHTDGIQLAYYLLSKGAFLNELFSYNQIKGPATTYYALHGDTKRLQILVECFHANVNLKDSRGRTALYYMLKMLSIDLPPKQQQEIEFSIELLISYGADIEELDVDGNTLLMTSIQKGNVLAAKLLSSYYAANLQTTNTLGENALTCSLKPLGNPDLHEADLNKFQEIARHLIQTTHKEQLKTTLIDNVYKGNELACRLLLEARELTLDEILDSEENSLVLKLILKEI